MPGWQAAPAHQGEPGGQPGSQGKPGQPGPQPSPQSAQRPAPGAEPPHWEPPRPEQQAPKRQTPHAPLTPTFQPREERRKDEPDWAALAAAQDRRNRRRRRLLIGGGIIAVGAAVAAAVILGGNEPGKGGGPKAGASSSPSNAPEPKFPEVTPPPPPNPLDIISSAEKDTAPLNTDSLFPGKRFSLGDRSYTEGPSNSTEDCASVALNGLAPILTRNECLQMLRSTYTRDGVSVTVGVAVFETRKAAEAVRKQATGHIEPLSGDGVGTFCRPVACWSSANAIGRYAYFTMAGFSNNTAVPSTDTQAKQSGRDVSTFAFRQITQRGKDAAGQ